MALQIFNADWVGNGVRSTLAVGTDSLYVMQDVVVGREDAAADDDYTVEATSSNHLLKIDGSVTGGVGIQLGDDLGDTTNAVLIGEAGAVQAFLYAPAIDITGRIATVENRGTIWSAGYGIRLELAAALGQTTIVNHGLIEADMAIFRTGGTQSIEVENHGIISADIAFDSNGDGIDQFINMGTVIGGIMLGGGNDYYDGRTGTLSDGGVNGESGEDWLIGGAGAEIFQGGDQNDTLEGRGGNDRLFGGTHSDTLLGGAGNDELFGQGGINTLAGGVGNDIYYVETAADVLTEATNQGIDTVVSSSTLTLTTNFERLTLDTLLAANGTGNAVANVIIGGSGANHIRGLAGNDRLLGMDGSDRLIGGVGRDLLTGGDQADRFIFSSVAESRAGDGIDTIIDFKRIDGDKIQLTAIDANTTQAGNQAFTFIGKSAFSGVAGQLRYEKNASGTDSIITADVNGDGKADLTIISDVAWNFIRSDFIL